MESNFKLVKKYFEDGVSLSDAQKINTLKQAFLQWKENASKIKVTEDESDDDALEEQENVNAIIEEFEERFLKLDEILNELQLKKEKEIEDLILRKKRIIADIKNLIQTEKDIKAAFTQFNDLREQWNLANQNSIIDDKGLEKQYAKLVEDFYYHINIYKDILEHDFKRNYQLKSNLITRLKGLLNLKVAKDILSKLKEIQKEWQSIGPVGRENKATIWEQYTELSDQVFNFYLSIKETEQKNNAEKLAKKKELILKAKELVNVSELKSSRDWKKATEDAINIQNEWKSLGVVNYKEDKQLFLELRKIMDAFFDLKSHFFEKEKAAYSENRLTKSKLIQEAEVLLALETKDREVINKVIELQKEWKKIGSAHPKDDQKLWEKFRKICNAFFEEKDAQRKAEKKQLNSVTDQKNDIIKSFTTKASEEEVIALIKAFTNTWEKSTPPTFKTDYTFENKLSDWLAEKNNNLELLKQFNSERVSILKSITFEDKESIKGLIKNLLNKEKEVLLKYENNLSFFSNAKPGNPLLEEVNKNLSLAKERVEGFQKMIRVV